jgi:hypothetical protein
MKKAILIFLVFLVPILAFAGNSGFLNKVIKHSNFPSPNRAYRLTEAVNYSYESEQWTLDDKEVYYYNATNSSKIDSVLYLSFDEDREWTPYMVRHIQYNPAGFITSSITYYIMGDMRIQFQRTLSEYDNQNRLLHNHMFISSLWGREENPILRYHFNYSGNAVTGLEMWSNWEEAEYMHSTFTLDGAGRIIEEISQTSPDSSQWVTSTKYVTTYHPNDTSTGSSIIQWIAQNLPMQDMNTDSEPFGMFTQTIDYDWNGTGWTPYERETYTWANNKLTILQNDLYQTDWVPFEKEEYLYDNNGNRIEREEQEYVNSAWVYNDKTEYSWQSVTTNEDIVSPAASNLSLNVYPQPFSNSVTIGMVSDKAGEVKLSIHNLKGQLITSFVGLPGSTLQWNGSDAHNRPCANGIYFLKAEQGNSQAIQRIIKLK